MANDSTKEKLLTAAVDVFARKGYRDATVAEICELAEANIASINYHFGSKDKLFRQVLRRAFAWAEAKYPIRGDLPKDAQPEERLKVFINAVIKRCFETGPAGQFDRIMSHEGTRESAPHEVIFAEINQLQGELLESILRSILNTRSQNIIHQARMNIVAICIFPNVASRLRKILFPKKMTPSLLQQYVDRQVSFALAGLAAMAKERKTKK